MDQLHRSIAKRVGCVKIIRELSDSLHVVSKIAIATTGDRPLVLRIAVGGIKIIAATIE